MRVRDNKFIFPTKRDYHAFSQVFKRSNLGIVDPEVKCIEMIVSEEITCDHTHPQGYDYENNRLLPNDCDKIATFRVVRNRGKGRIYSQNYCRECFVSELNYWLNNMLAQMTDLVESEGLTHSD